MSGNGLTLFNIIPVSEKITLEHVVRGFTKKKTPQEKGILTLNITKSDDPEYGHFP